MKKRSGQPLPPRQRKEKKGVPRKVEKTEQKARLARKEHAEVLLANNKSSTFCVALMGKTNVGKSSLFNALIGKNKAIISPKSHVTRDAIFSFLPLPVYLGASHQGGQSWRRGASELTGKEISNPAGVNEARQIKLMDLAGLFFPGEVKPYGQNVRSETYKDFEQQLLKKLRDWLEEAHQLLLVLDLHNITHEDMRIIAWLKSNFAGKPLQYVVNKFDGSKDEAMMGEVFSWKIIDPMWVSAKHSYGLTELRKYIGQQAKAWFAKNKVAAQQLVKEEDLKEKTADIKIVNVKEGEAGKEGKEGKAGKAGKAEKVGTEKSEVAEEAKTFNFCVAILGKPNAGKSSLLNAFLKENRALVSSMPGTTRDAIDASALLGEYWVRFIDTAGLRRKAKVHESVESSSVSRAVRALDASHLAILLIDASEPISDQDKKIAGLANHHEKALMVIFNKWDLVSQSWEKFVDRQLFLFPLLKKFILLPLSVKSGFHFSLLKKKVTQLLVSTQETYKTSLLNSIAQKALEKNPPPIIKQSRRPFAIKYVVQISNFPVKLRIYCARPKALNASYETYLLNMFRKELHLQGLPLRLYFEAPSSRKTQSYETKSYDINEE